MRADRVEVSWDSEKSQWLVRVATGDEVVRRHLKLANDTDEPALRAAAQKIVRDEGYEIDPSAVSIRRAQTAS